MKFIRSPIFLWGFGGFVTQALWVMLCYRSVAWWGERQWVQTQAELRAKGEKLHLVELAPPPIPDKENFFAAPVWQAVIDAPKDSKEKPLQIFSDILKGPKGEALPRSAGLDTGQPQNLAEIAQILRPSDSSPEATPANAVLEALSVANPELAAIQQAAERPLARYPVKYEEGFRMALPHAFALLKTAQYLNLRITAEADAGKSEEALRHLLLLFYLADSLNEEPVLISQLVRVSILQIATQVIWEGQVRHAWSVPQLIAIQQRLNEVQIENGLRQALRGERGNINQTFDPILKAASGCKLAAVLSGLLNSSDSADQRETLFVAQLYPRGWIFQDIAYSNNLLQRAIEQGSALEQADYWKTTVEPELSDIAASPRRFTHFISLFTLPAVGGSMKSFQKTETRLRQAQIACALERYRIAEGTYPAQLTALVPQYLTELPLDICNQEDFRYRQPAPDQFILWSVGPDRTDDQGKPMAKISSPTGDWVWQTVSEDHKDTQNRPGTN